MSSGDRTVAATTKECDLANSCQFLPCNLRRDAPECDASPLRRRGMSGVLFMEKIVISPAEVAETQVLADQPARLEPKLVPAVPQWAKWTLAPLVLILPLLCLVAIVLRVAM